MGKYRKDLHNALKSRSIFQLQKAFEIQKRNERTKQQSDKLYCKKVGNLLNSTLTLNNLKETKQQLV